MKEHPILFSTEMVRAILDGRKTMTRRVVKEQPRFLSDVRQYHLPNGQWKWVLAETGMGDGTTQGFKCPYGQVGDRLWVRETWAYSEKEERYRYKESTPIVDWSQYGWRPSIHMFRHVSRITLETTNIRVERLQEITEKDAKNEGSSATIWGVNDKDYSGLPGFPDQRVSYKNGFSILWDSINGKKYPWSSNPWVWVIEFRRLA